ncbi:DUF4864 domain-containing protein [Ramlibacter sp. USB13]|uniref:DUF4864 domain-containing protein n=1 Tax=Ramlibacter cellulosilyticus TaxID=2764187 RepID=A0A923S9V8_9BURK|nr:DUF4864 domain-containing protein [Ramlibacter cellulosilyticus]MBC5782081.1 DUF4864 domain-containing protein [Ramlibacter cellulosilyticus]
MHTPSPSDFALRPRHRRPRAGVALAWSLLFSAVLGGAVFASDPAHLRVPGEADNVQVVRTVVQQQLAAFANEDALQAFALADTDLRTQFGTAEAFLATVREQYPMLMHPTSVLFLKPETDGRIALQRVRVADEEGSSWTLTYLLNREGGRQWRISGCVVTPEGRQILT